MRLETGNTRAYCHHASGVSQLNALSSHSSVGYHDPNVTDIYVHTEIRPTRRPYQNVASLAYLFSQHSRENNIPGCQRPTKASGALI